MCVCLLTEVLICKICNLFLSGILTKFKLVFITKACHNSVALEIYGDDDLVKG